MSEDVKIDGINISAMLRNFDTLRGIVKKQGETIATQKKDLKLCFSRNDALRKVVDKKEDSAAGMMADLMGGYRK